VVSITTAILLFIAAILEKVHVGYRRKLLRRGAEFILLSTTAAFFSLLSENDVIGFAKMLNDSPTIITFAIPLILLILLIADIALTMIELSGSVSIRKTRSKRKRKAKGGSSDKSK